MPKAVQQAVQGRDGAVQPDDTVISTPWSPRSDDKRALLVSPRTTVFDRPAPATLPIDPLEAISDPIWNDQGGKSWTPDLVHARLLLTGEVIKRMPPVLAKRWGSQLGHLVPSDSPRCMALTPQEVSIADWTLAEIMGRAHRKVLLASSLGYSGDKIAEALKARGVKIGGTTVQRLYLSERRIMAGQWQARHVAVDALTLRRRDEVFAKRQK